MWSETNYPVTQCHTQEKKPSAMLLPYKILQLLVTMQAARPTAQLTYIQPGTESFKND